MTDYVEISFENLNTEQKDIIIASLSEMNYEGFEEEGDLLRAYISTNLYDEKELTDLAVAQNLSFTKEKIQGKNWNKEWESNFHPVIINHSIDNSPWVGIRADFHEPIKNVRHEIIITPKMSFGTGHHATTSMMIRMMSELDFSGKNVLDYGTGTGILAILSEKMGAANIVAVDNDNQSIENSYENFKSNNCSKIQLLLSSSACVEGKFDIILANIVRLVIQNNLSAFIEQLAPDGVILLSGLLEDEEKETMSSAMKYHLKLKKKIEVDDWICLQMTRERSL